MLNILNNFVQVTSNSDRSDLLTYLDEYFQLLASDFQENISGAKLNISVIKSPSEGLIESLQKINSLAIEGSKGDDTGVFLSRLRNDFAIMDNFSDLHLSDTYFTFYETELCQNLIEFESEIRIRSFLDASFAIMNSSDCMNIIPLYKMEFPELWQERVSTVLRSIVWHNKAVASKPGEVRIKPAGINVDTNSLDFEQLAFVIQISNDFDLTTKFHLYSPLLYSDPEKNIPGLYNILLASYLPKSYNMKIDELKDILICSDSTLITIDDKILSYGDKQISVDIIKSQRIFFEIPINTSHELKFTQ